MWQFSFGNLWLCEAEKNFWRVAKTNWRNEAKLKQQKTMGHCAQDIRANLILLFTLLLNFSGRWVARVQSEGEWGRENCLISLVQHAGVWMGVWLQTWHTVTALVPSSAWQGCPWGSRTSAILLLAGDLLSFLMAEGWGVELALGTGCSFFERWELFCSRSLRFTVGPQWLSPHGVPSLSLLSWPMLWFPFSFHPLS